MISFADFPGPLRGPNLIKIRAQPTGKYSSVKRKADILQLCGEKLDHVTISPLPG